jgi:hypothetical protein
LLELGGRAALVAQDCLVESFPQPDSVREQWLYRVCIAWPLRVFDATARFLRHAPGARKTFVVGSIAYVVLAMVVNTFWLKALYANDGVQREVALVLFVIGPIVSGTFSWLLVRPFRSRPPRLGIVRLLRFAAVVLAVGATAKLLDADHSTLCASAPFELIGQHCSTVVRSAILLLPIAVGMFLGAFVRGGPPRTEREPRRP